MGTTLSQVQDRSREDLRKVYKDFVRITTSAQRAASLISPDVITVVNALLRGELMRTGRRRKMAIKDASLYTAGEDLLRMSNGEADQSGK